MASAQMELPLPFPFLWVHQLEREGRCHNTLKPSMPSRRSRALRIVQPSILRVINRLRMARTTGVHAGHDLSAVFEHVRGNDVMSVVCVFPRFWLEDAGRAGC